MLGVACGDNGTIIFQTNFGSVVGDPTCNGPGGRFAFRDTGGLLLVVIVDDDTTIFLASGDVGACRDLTAGTNVEVRGSQTGGEIAARDVFVR